jgi:hypothetical protein
MIVPKLLERVFALFPANSLRQQRSPMLGLSRVRVA